MNENSSGQFKTKNSINKKKVLERFYFNFSKENMKKYADSAAQLWWIFQVYARVDKNVWNKI